MAPPDHSVEIFVPLVAAADPAYLRALEQELLDRFGGVTSFARAPAQGRWTDGGTAETDELIIFQVMTAGLDRPWWAALRARLERDLEQKEVLIRAQPVERL